MRIQHVTRGCLSFLGVLLHPLGRFCGSWLNDLRTPERLEQGLVLVLPGIEGQSLLNHSIARGFADGGMRSAIEVFDWTTGVILMFLYHLRSSRLHQVPFRAAMIADFNFGGHIGVSNRVFVARHVAPLICKAQKTASGVA